jgi:hypothetical protein
MFHTIERAIGRPIRPHLMSVELAEQRGQVPQKKAASARCPPDSGMVALVAYLAGEDAKTLEQEELDPRFAEPFRLFATSDRRAEGRSTGPRGEASLVGENEASSRILG